jgi:hypothetical protein
MKERAITVRPRRVVVRPEQPPGTFHKVLWTRLGKDLILEFAHMDLETVRLAMEDAETKGASEIDVTLFISQRYSMTPGSVIELLRSVTEVARDLVTEGLLTAEEFEKQANLKELK